jgi:hypothetical protein
MWYVASMADSNTGGFVNAYNAGSATSDTGVRTSSPNSTVFMPSSPTYYSPIISTPIYNPPIYNPIVYSPIISPVVTQVVTPVSTPVVSPPPETQVVYSSTANRSPSTIAAVPQPAAPQVAVMVRPADNGGALQASAIAAQNNFMPSGAIQWILFAGLIVVIVALARKIFSAYKATPVPPIEYY